MSVPVDAPVDGHAARSPEEVLRLSIERLVLERAACSIERLTGNPTYVQAWRLAARAVRALKRD